MRRGILQPAKIGDWDTTALSKYVTDVLGRQPATQQTDLTVDTLKVNKILSVDGSVDFTLRVRTVGNAGEPAFQNSWVNYGGAYAPAAFVQDVHGFVYLQGAIKSGTLGTVAFRLPPGMNPKTSRTFAVISNGTVGAVLIDSAGQVIPSSPSSNVLVFLDGINFLAS